MTNSKTKRLVVSGVMIALATVLSLIRIWKMPLGGSVTLLSMLPIVLLSIKYGPKWGLFSAFAYSIIQLAIDLPDCMSWGLTATVWVGMILLDYLLPFTLLGLAGVFRKKGFVGEMCGIAMVICLRFVSHLISGIILWTNVTDTLPTPFLFSFAYNGTYMLPELISTLIGAGIVFAVPDIRKITSAE